MMSLIARTFPELNCVLILQNRFGREQDNLTYRLIVIREISNIYDKHLHFLDKISLEIGLDLNKMILRFRLESGKQVAESTGGSNSVSCTKDALESRDVSFTFHGDGEGAGAGAGAGAGKFNLSDQTHPLYFRLPTPAIVLFVCFFFLFGFFPFLSLSFFFFCFVLFCFCFFRGGGEGEGMFPGQDGKGTETFCSKHLLYVRLTKTPSVIVPHLHGSFPNCPALIKRNHVKL